MRRLWIAACSAALSLVPGAMAIAQAPACRVDVWLAQGLETNSDGAVLIEAHNRALRDRDGHPSMLADMLTPAAQRSALTGMDLPALLGQAGSRMVLHDGPVDGTTAPAPCGGALVLQHIVFSHNQLSRTALQGIFAWRPYGGARPFTTLVSTPLPHFTIDADPVSADSALRVALVRNLEQFAGYAVAARR
ncbi:hypothetical protein [Sphingomonas oryzagri]|jgi:hypothetical protein|uniref:Uncharacterized protein n=1 Tax=Sphingomonas oryzagri TaxID=3042314 RepID=A0ABT6N4Q0_9SPHN|nr:hypothetical protein [Sphingomonas oryzagri]MDH7639948.1 hypothetical protein [Sphingomonas oryzagri]